jgi:intracellular sulfur oxidation DsrE/DsrF family protein
VSRGRRTRERVPPQAPSSPSPRVRGEGRGELPNSEQIRPWRPRDGCSRRYPEPLREERQPHFRVLNNARNAHELYQERGEEVAIEIVAYSQGLHMLRDDTSPVKQEIRDLRKKVPQVAFGACNNTKMAMERREGKPVPIIPEATIVPAGIVRLVELQEDGYSYVKP